MKHINDDNIDEIMFQLLEGDITGMERAQLLEAIEADEAYKKLWAAWQQTILKPGEDMLVMNTGKLKKKSARIIPWHYKYAVAAIMVLGIGLSVFFYNQDTSHATVADGIKPARTKQPVRQVPQPEITKDNNHKEDSNSVVPLKEKIRTMAGRDVQKPFHGKESKTDACCAEMENANPSGKMAVENTKAPVQNVPQIPVIQAEEDHTIVTMSSVSKPAASQAEGKSRENLLTRLFGKPKFKLEHDSSTRTNKRLIIENKQYKIIAGF